ncbi:hypothetical protein CORC01_06328 [Colletotrichum orchidophilum]|uniref:Uncharacterized protein n=1 Tax=Colletotrichum orchidophilum TaxID=1209926 RepID=A0A1G4BAK9_9PEZI|nr:uncharacterized protein CORC01_06328 [Colletotrichum orchidophilum]OHE98332.1 hypothetical protein CORC01_06328 [Colletotrichum orchidophilum]
MYVLGISDCDFKDNETRCAMEALGSEMQPLESPAALSSMNVNCWVISFGSPISRFSAKVVRHSLTATNRYERTIAEETARWSKSFRDAMKAEVQPDGAVGKRFPTQDPVMRAMALSDVDGRSARIAKRASEVLHRSIPMSHSLGQGEEVPEGRRLTMPIQSDCDRDEEPQEGFGWTYGGGVRGL